MDIDVETKYTPVLPAVGQEITAEQLNQEHPNRTATLLELRFHRTTYEGSGGYAPHYQIVKMSDAPPTDDGQSTMAYDADRETWLWRHPREKKKFERRVLQAYNVNVVRKIVTSIVGFLMRKPPSRDDYADAVTAWLAKVTKDGLSWDQLLRTRIAPLTMVCGWLPVLVHFEQTAAQTKEQETELGGGPFATPIMPESIWDWAEDGRGGFLWLKYREQTDQTADPLAKGHKLTWRTHYLTQLGWWYVDHVDEHAKASPVVAVGEWPGGEMPLTVWRIAGGSLIAGAAPTQRELFNVLSLEQEQERETAFSMLVMEDPGKDRKVRIISTGSDNALLVREGCTTKPYWLAIDGGVLEHFQTKISRLVTHILSEFSLEFDDGAASGVALSFKMSKITRLLVDLSSAFAVGEIQTHMHAAAALGATMPETAASTWPKRYDETDIERELKALSDVLMMDIGPTLSACARYRAAQAAMPDLDEKTLETGWTEIEAEAEEKDAVDEKMAALREQAAAAPPVAPAAPPFGEKQPAEQPGQPPESASK